MDGLRGLAAFYVLVGHARWLLWEGYQSYSIHPESYSWFGRAQVYGFSLFRYGHEAVLFFFVLSGFLIHLSYARKLTINSSQRFDWWNYLKRRARRIYPPLLFALALTFVFDSLGQLVFEFGIYRGETDYPLINKNIESNISWPILWGNLGFLMDAYVPTFGVNGPLWSLKYEWWFYMLYPFFWLATRRSIGLATTAMMVLFLLSFWPNYWPVYILAQVFSLMLSWWFGALLADVYVGRISISLRWLMPLSLALIPGLAGYFPGSVLNDTSCALGFIGVLASCFHWQDYGRSLGLLDKLKWLGDCSYTLYVIHFPILVFASGWVLANDQRLPRHFGLVWLSIILLVLFAWLIHFGTERPFISRKSRVVKIPTS